MTKVTKQAVKCIKCGKESSQLLIHSVNFSLGKKEDNEKLMKHLQKCPFCGYEAPLISMEIK